MPALRISGSRAVQAAVDNGGRELRPGVMKGGEIVSRVARLQARVRKRSGTTHSNFIAG